VSLIPGLGVRTELTSYNRLATGQPTASLSTRIESHIPGTQAHREREYLNQAPLHGGVPPTTNMNAQAPNMNSQAPNMNAQAPVYNNDVAPGGGGIMGGRTHGGVAPVSVAPAGNRGATMGERVGDLQGRHAPHAAGATAPLAGHGTSATGTKPHLGDKVLGGVELAVGRATNNPVMEQKGWERKVRISFINNPTFYSPLYQTFGDPKHRQDAGVQPVTQQQQQQQQGYGVTGQPAQQGFNNAQPGYPPQTQPPAGY
jgi:hypothetical protein